MHLIPYEYFVGAYLGQSFRIKGLIHHESFSCCYELYAVEPIFQTSHVYEARAYRFQGIAYRERKYRLRNFKRCQSNRFCELSLDQGGKRWVISRCGSKNEEETHISSVSSRATGKETPAISSCDKGDLSNSPSQIPTTEISKQVDRVRERTRSHAPNNTGNVIPDSTDPHGVRRASPLEVRIDSVQTKLEESATMSDVGTLVVAKGSAADSSSSSDPAKKQKTPILPLPDVKGKASAATSESRQQKSPEQRGKRNERRRRAQQVRRMLKSDKPNPEPTPRTFMQWEKSEVRTLLYKQELTLKATHQAELERQAGAMTLRHQAELKWQAEAMTLRHQAELERQAKAINLRHQERFQGLYDLMNLRVLEQKLKSSQIRRLIADQAVVRGGIMSLLD